MKQNLHNIFNKGACPSSDDLQLYLRGSMSSEDANALEQHIESCELCADAMEGLQEFEQAEKLDSIKADLDLRVDSLLQEDKKSVLFSGWYKIAAVFVILAMVGGVLYMNNQFSNKNQKIFTEHYKPFEQDDDKAESMQKESLKSEFSDNNETIIGEAEKEIPVEDEAMVLEDFDNNNINNLDIESDLIGKNKTAITAAPSAPTAIALERQAVDLIAEEKTDSESPAEEIIAADDAYVVNVRGGRDNAADYNVDGIKVQELKNNEVAAMQSDKMKSVTVIEEITVAKDSKKRKAMTRKENRRPEQLEQSTAAGNSEEAFFNGANIELITANYNNGEEEYKKENYEQAGLWFQKVLQLDAGHYQSNFYAGLCALQLEQAEMSVDYLNMVIGKEKEVLYEPALWYISLAHIKLDDSRKAKKYLKMIIPLNGEYKVEAEKLLKEL